MKKNFVMKKNTFLSGALITSLGIIFSKFLGVFYVIFFHSIVGDQGGALYGYSYTVYNFFLSIATLSIPLSISKMVSSYQSLGYYQIKKRCFVLAKKISLLLSVLSFLIVFFFAPFISRWILGSSSTEHIKDVIFVIRIVGISLLIVPVMNVYRGYFEGHRFFIPSTISQILEQIFRVLIILLGSFLSIKLFHLSISTTIGVCLFGTFVGGIISYVYLVTKYLLHKEKFSFQIRKVSEPVISDSLLIKKIIYFSIPFMAINLFQSFFHMIDLFTVVKGLVSLNYSLVDAESIYSILSLWANKFLLVVLVISSGVITSMVPSLEEAIGKKNNKNIESIIHQGFHVFLYFSIPMIFGISFLSKEIWTFLYGNSTYGPNILAFSIFIGLFIGVFSILMIILQSLKEYKGMILSIISGSVIKILFNTYFLSTFQQIGLPAYYGVIFSSILGYFISSFVCFFYLKKKYQLTFFPIFKNLIDILILSIGMILLLFLLRFFLPISYQSKVLFLFLLFLYVLLGVSFYLLLSNKIGLFQKIFHKDIFQVFQKNKTK